MQSILSLNRVKRDAGRRYKRWGGSLWPQVLSLKSACLSRSMFSEQQLLGILCPIVVEAHGADNSINRHVGNLTFSAHLVCNTSKSHILTAKFFWARMGRFYLLYSLSLCLLLRYLKKKVVKFNCSEFIALEWHGGNPSSLHFMDKGRRSEIKRFLGNLSLGFHDTAFLGFPSTSLTVWSPTFCWLLSRCPDTGCPPKLCPWSYTVLSPSYTFMSWTVTFILMTLKY